MINEHDHILLKETYTDLLKNYTRDPQVVADCWTEIEQNYTDKKRDYHTLDHLVYLLKQLLAIKKEIKDWDTVLFTLYYHDIVYNATGEDNEEKSAELAEKRMKELAVPDTMIVKCTRQIMATKNHVNSQDTDTNYFTDADLSILGQDWEKYTLYYKGVRKEYSMYPDFLYGGGRKKVLKRFLNMATIFKTEHFQQKYEEQARINVKKEITLL